MGDAVVSSLLLETDSDGRFSHTELSTAAGLLTLHPESDGTVHGNTVGEHGIGHLVGLPWDPDGLFLVEGSAIAVAAAALHAGSRVAVGSTSALPAVVASLDLGLSGEDMPVRRPSAATWQIGGQPTLTVDERGLPVLVDGIDWPLEAAGAGDPAR